MFDHFMTRIILFNILLLATCGYAILRGGTPEKLTGWLLMAAAALTLLTGWRQAMFQQVEITMFSIDLALLAGLVVIALKADRLWPMVLAALQLDSAAIHVLKLLDADMIRITYALMVAIWSYPMLLVLAIGTIRHRRRLAQFGEDRAWSLAIDRISGETANVARYDNAQPGHGPWGSRTGNGRAERDQG
jgi:hypothetical protein